MSCRHVVERLPVPRPSRRPSVHSQQAFLSTHAVGAQRVDTPRGVALRPEREARPVQRPDGVGARTRDRQTPRRRTTINPPHPQRVVIVGDRDGSSAVGESLGNRPGPAGVTGVTVPLTSRETMEASAAAAGRYASVPLFEIATCAAPVSLPGSLDRLMPCTIAVAGPARVSERTSKGTANKVEPTAYTRCPVLGYRPSAPPSMRTVRVPEDSAWRDHLGVVPSIGAGGGGDGQQQMFTIREQLRPIDGFTRTRLENSRGRAPRGREAEDATSPRQEERVVGCPARTEVAPGSLSITAIGVPPSTGTFLSPPYAALVNATHWPSGEKVGVVGARFCVPAIGLASAASRDRRYSCPLDTNTICVPSGEMASTCRPVLLSTVTCGTRERQSDGPVGRLD